MTQKPFFSVVIPSHGRPELLSRALASVKRQTFCSYEVLVIDDASPDSLENCALESSIENIKFIRTKINVGGAQARNIGVDNSQGEYISFLDSDDYWDPEKLGIVASAIRELPHPPVVFNACAIKKENRVKNTRLCNAGMYSSFLDFIFRGGGLLQTSALTLRRDVAVSTPFNPVLKRHQDLDLYNKLSLHFANSLFIDELLSTWDISHESPSITKTSSVVESISWADSVRHDIGDKSYYEFIRKYIYEREATGRSLLLLERLEQGMLTGSVPRSAFFISKINRLIRRTKARWKHSR